MLAAPFNLSRLELTGASVSALDGVMYTGAPQLSISDTGSLVYVPGGNQASSDTLVWIDRQGREEPVSAPPRSYSKPRISPDGQQVAVVIDYRQIEARRSAGPFPSVGSQNRFV